MIVHTRSYINLTVTLDVFAAVRGKMRVSESVSSMFLTVFWLVVTVQDPTKSSVIVKLKK